MAYYSIQHVSILLDLLLAEEKLTRNFKGLKELLKKVEEDVDFEDEKDRTGVEYLSKLNNRIKKRIKKEETTIAVKNSCLQHCLEYLGYDSFQEVTLRIDKVQEQVSKLLSEKNEIAILFPDGNKNRLREDIEMAQYEGQELSYLEQQYHPENTSWTEEVLSKPKDRAIFWLIPDTLIKKEFQQIKKVLKDAARQTHQILPFFLTSKQKELKTIQENLNTTAVLGGDEDLKVLVQVLLREMKNTREEKNSKLEEENSNVSIKKATNVFLGGKMKVKGTYVSQGDMTINTSKS